MAPNKDRTGTQDIDISGSFKTDVKEKSGQPLLGVEEIPQRFPRFVALIIGNELCERFAFYGLKAILPLYFKEELNYTEDDSTAIIHGFIAFSYACALFGGYISDVCLGKYKTIVYLTLVYVIGAALLSATAVESIGAVFVDFGPMLSLFLVGLGTGGIKPCVSAFVGDQFGPSNAKYLDMVFAVFYFSINTGSLMSTVITPIVRENVSYAAAFSIPAALLPVALFLFMLATPYYTYVKPGKNIYGIVITVIRTAWRRKREGHVPPTYSTVDGEKPHWLDYAAEECGTVMVQHVKSLIRIGKVFLVIPVFWSLYDQSSTRWVYQAQAMDLLNGSVTADQIQVLNPALLLGMIPIFNRGIYPAFKRCGWEILPLKRIGIGMILTAVAFFMCALLQMHIDTQPEKSVSVLLQIPQFLIMSAGEIMVSITGLEFAYGQAPITMKGVIMAMWLLTVAFGNGIVILMSLFVKGDPYVLFWIFGVAMFVFALGFLYFTHGYVYESYLPTTTKAVSSDTYSAIDRDDPDEDSNKTPQP